mmetsp:Transcript_1719/g.4285  ORF Transcript_1719/g.4285 Transcript_1719/m.4285 type:complete len:200 (-) Transcript_1719:1714-2313(-)
MTALKKMLPAICSGTNFSKHAVKAIPAPWPKPASTTSLQDKPNLANWVSTPSTNARPKSSMSCNMSKSSFSKVDRSLRYQEPSKISGALRFCSARPSLAACCFHESMTMPISLPSDEPKPWMREPSGLVSSPSQTKRVLGETWLPPSNRTGMGPSGLWAATLFGVNKRFNQSALSFSLSSSSFGCPAAAGFGSRSSPPP